MGLFESFVSNSSYSSRGYDAALDCMLESVDADMDIIRAMHNYEMLSIQMESGQYVGEEVLTEAAGDVVNKIKTAFSKLINAIRERLIAVKNWLLKKAKAFKEWAKGLKNKKKDKKADKPASDAHKKDESENTVWEYDGLVKIVNSGKIEGTGRSWAEPFLQVMDKSTAYLRSNSDYSFENFAKVLNGEAADAIGEKYADKMREGYNNTEMRKELRGKMLQPSQFVMVHKDPEAAVALYEKGAHIVDKELADVKSLENAAMKGIESLKHLNMGRLYSEGDVLDSESTKDRVQKNIKDGESRGQTEAKLTKFATSLYNRLLSNIRAVTTVTMNRLNLIRSELDGFSRAITRCELEYYAI